MALISEELEAKIRKEGIIISIESDEDFRSFSLYARSITGRVYHPIRAEMLCKEYKRDIPQFLLPHSHLPPMMPLPLTICTGFTGKEKNTAAFSIRLDVPCPYFKKQLGRADRCMGECLYGRVEGNEIWEKTHLDERCRHVEIEDKRMLNKQGGK